jgi:hypothetical protein
MFKPLLHLLIALYRTGTQQEHAAVKFISVYKCQYAKLQQIYVGFCNVCLNSRLQFYVIVLRHKDNFKLYCRVICFEFMKLIINVHEGILSSPCQTEMLTKLKFSLMN